jgi:hypothetical protein
MKRWILIALALCGLALIGYALFAEPSDEERILAQLERLEHAVSVEEPAQNMLLRKSRIDSEFREIFDKDVSFAIPELSGSHTGRNELGLLAARAGTYYETIDLGFSDVSVTVGNVGAHVRGSATLTASRSGNPERDTRQVEFQFSKVDGDWLVTSISVAPKTGVTLEDKF